MDKFTADDLENAMDELSMCQFFPTDPGTRSAIMALLARMVPHREALIWLVRTMSDKIGAWKGPMELRGVLCTRWKPADGIEAESTLIGFRGEDSEQACLEEHAQRKVGWVAAEGEPPKQISADRQARALIEGLASGKVM